MTNSYPSLNQTSPNRQPSRYILKPNQKVYLYGDTNFTGTLIRPLERTYPPRWTVQLDRGGYDSATISEIIPINPQYITTETDIPFDESGEIDTFSQEQARVEEVNRILELERENEILKTQNQKLQQENETLKKDLAQAKQVIRRAKDISPLMRISLKRVLRLAKDARDGRTTHRRGLDTPHGRQS